MTKRTTLADIARECDVSVATVSMVLREKPGSIPAETRRRIRATARTLGYTPRTPREPAASPPRTLGVVVKSLDDLPPHDNPFYSGILAGIEDACRRRHLNLLYATLPVDVNNHPTQYPRLLHGDAVQGLMIVGVWVNDPLQRVLDELGAPVVLVDAYAEGGDYDAVVSDNRPAACQAVTQLIAHGHRHIGLALAWSGGYPSIRERRAGYLDALREHGLTETYIADSSDAPERVEGEVRRLLEANPQITAIFGGNDLTTLAAARAARALGRRIPADLSIVGFDDIDLAQYVSPPLTTMHVDTVGMGRMAMQLLMNRLEHPDAERVTAVMRPRLVERQSVAVLPDTLPLPAETVGAERAPD